MGKLEQKVVLTQDVNHQEKSRFMDDIFANSTHCESSLCYCIESLSPPYHQIHCHLVSRKSTCNTFRHPCLPGERPDQDCLACNKHMHVATPHAVQLLSLVPKCSNSNTFAQRNMLLRISPENLSNSFFCGATMSSININKSREHSIL